LWEGEPVANHFREEEPVAEKRAVANPFRGGPVGEKREFANLFTSG
jgi:hypothetical protein